MNARVKDWPADDLEEDWCDQEKERLLAAEHLRQADTWIASREQAYRERALATGNIWHLVGFQREATR